MLTSLVPTYLGSFRGSQIWVSVSLLRIGNFSATISLNLLHSAFFLLPFGTSMKPTLICWMLSHESCRFPSFCVIVSSFSSSDSVIWNEMSLSLLILLDWICCRSSLLNHSVHSLYFSALGFWFGSFKWFLSLGWTSNFALVLVSFWFYFMVYLYCLVAQCYFSRVLFRILCQAISRSPFL